MKILWTHKPGSVVSESIIRLTGEPCSHVAIEFAGGFILHSNFRGMGVEWRSTFHKTNEVVFQLEPPAHLAEKLNNIDYIDKTMLRLEHSYYDTAALLFLGGIMIARRWGLPLPKQNLWQISGMLICTEFVTEYIDEKADSMITPLGLFNRLSNSGWTQTP